MTQKKSDTIHDILNQKEDFIVVGLTGRMGSGCSKVAELLASSFEQINFPHPVPQPGLRSLTDEERTIRIIAEFAEVHWLKFEVIQVSAIIATFILDDDSRFVRDISKGVSDKMNDKRMDFRKKLWENFCRKIVELCQNFGLLEKRKDIEYIKVITDETEKSDNYVKIGDNVFMYKIQDDVEHNLKKELKDIGKKLKKEVNDDSDFVECFDEEKDNSFVQLLFKENEDSSEIWKQIGSNMSCLYSQVLQNHPNIHRRKYLELVDKLVELFSIRCLMTMMDKFLSDSTESSDVMWNYLVDIKKSLEPNSNDKKDVLQIYKFVFVKYITTWFGRTVREWITENLNADTYARLFQRYGQMIRYYGYISAYNDEEKRIEKSDESLAADDEAGNVKKQDIFAIPRMINEHIKILRHPFARWEHRPVRVVVDSIKNVFEAVYLRYRYSAFYLWAITTDSAIRERRLRDKHLTDIQVRKLDWNEYPDKGGEVIKEAQKIVDKLKRDNEELHSEKIRKAIVDKLGSAEADFYQDRLDNEQQDDEVQSYLTEYEEFNIIRRSFFTDNTYAFYTQDVDSCVCNADVYLFNNGTGITDTESNRRLLETVVRNVSLVMYPCLVRPTPVERCMQIALSAKVNSGCLSRQVGAVVTDSQYNILSIGWNDVPCGEVSCAYKNIQDILVSADVDAYSDYELHDPDFRKRIRGYERSEDKLRGLPFSYCFKNVHKKERDPMRSRAMHAEEKALALCGKEAEGGYLFTTSSPCEMCSKNAKNHKIRKIYYLEAYPGISQTQYTNSGTKDNRAELILFSGTVGRAYMQMYTPLLPHKDILEYLGISKID